MDRRIELHEILCYNIGSRNVYFQAPENFTMNYPCIRYRLADAKVAHADNKKYEKMKAYEVILITDDPDDWRWNCIFDLPYCFFERHYISDGLNHYVFTIYY